MPLKNHAQRPILWDCNVECSGHCWTDVMNSSQLSHIYVKHYNQDDTETSQLLHSCRLHRGNGENEPVPAAVNWSKRTVLLQLQIHKLATNSYS